MNNDAVQWLERDYDNWKYTTTGDLIRVVNRRALSGGPGPSHDQPMIRLKNDLPHHPMFGSAEEALRTAYYCLSCASGHPHQCCYCATEITHMAGTTCPQCWWEEEYTS